MEQSHKTHNSFRNNNDHNASVTETFISLGDVEKLSKKQEDYFSYSYRTTKS